MTEDPEDPKIAADTTTAREVITDVIDESAPLPDEVPDGNVEDTEDEEEDEEGTQS